MHSTATVSSGVRLRSHATNAGGSAAAKADSKGNCGVSIWVLVLLDKYSSYRPTERLLGQLEQYDLDLPGGTINDGLQRIEPMLQPIYEALCQRNRQGDFHQADETRWLVFAILDGKKGYGWWLWVILGADTVVYLLDPSRGHEVPQSHLGPDASGYWKWIGIRLQGHDAGQKRAVAIGVLLGARAARLRGRGQELDGVDALAFEWLRRIRHVYRLNRERLQHPFDSVKFQEQDVLLRRVVEAMCAEAVTELSNPKLRQPCRKVLESLQEHWSGLVRFVDDPRIPLDNNASERAARGRPWRERTSTARGLVEWPAGRDDVFVVGHAGSLANQSAVVADVVLRELCGGRRKSPDDIQQFLPWNLSPERHAALAEQAASPSTADTS